MAGQNEETLENKGEQVPSDPWALAFAAISEEDKASPETAADTGEPGDGVPMADADQADRGEDSDAPEQDDGNGAEEVSGGPGDLGGDDNPADEELDWDGIDLSAEEIEQYRKSFTEKIHQQVIDDVASAYIRKGARHQNGRLGATINDPDVCRRDQDGVPRFYNPETGREFTGDNPRRQAQEWVEDYNRELSEQFNRTCEGYEKKLMEQQGGQLAIVEFAPKYKQLDPVRRSMFESIIEDYEVTDNDGNVIAYSCDLDKALAAVNRQVRVIQQRFSKQGVTTKSQPSGPALDTPSMSGQQGGAGKPQFKSLAEAMEWEQDRMLENMRDKKGRK